MQITTHYNKAVKVSRAAVGMLERKVYPFNLPDLFPDAIVPNRIEKGSYEHALYLFYACSLDSMRESKSVYKRVRELHKHLDFSTIHDLDKSYIKWVIDKYFEKPKQDNKGGVVMGDPIKTFIENSQRLQAYDRDPRNIKGLTVEQTIENITKFRQYGPQKTALLLKNMVKSGIWNFSYRELPIKIDRHAIRISIATEVIEFPGKEEEEEEEVRFDLTVPYLSKLYQRVVAEQKINPINLNDAFWAIGQYLCKENNGITCALDCELGCKTRPYTDRKFTTILPSTDTRKNSRNLFNYKN